MYIKKRSRITVYMPLYKKKATCFSHHQAGYRALKKKTIKYKKMKSENSCFVKI